MTEPISTAEIRHPYKDYRFNGSPIRIYSAEGVVGDGNYYADIALAHLLPFASDERYEVALDPGVGRGINLVALLSLANFKKGIGLDKNQKAIDLTRRNLEYNRITKPVDLLSSDAVPYMEQDFEVDFIMFDLPMLPVPVDSDLPLEIKSILDGGITGRRYLDFMISHSGSHLLRGGALFFVQPDFSNGESLDMLADNGFEPKMLAQEKKYLSETYTTHSLRRHIESANTYQFQSDNQGDYFMLQVITGTKR